MSKIFKRTPKQIEATSLLCSIARNILLYGGSRSGKTFIIIRAMIMRAIKTQSRHVILRHHFSHVKQSVWYDTLPEVMSSCFPGLSEQCKWDKSDWFVTLPGGSELWIGGLDDKERTEKILGKEFSTMFFNECSELSYHSINIALTRLAQRNALRKRAYFDCNPPKPSHWSHKMFIEYRDPLSDQPYDDCTSYASMRINPKDNEDNIDPDYIREVLDKLPPHLRARFRDGLFVSDDKDVIRPEWIYPSEEIGEIAAKFSFVDPAFTEEEKATENSCESAIVTVGIDYYGIVHDLEVLHGLWSYQQLKDNCVAVNKRHNDVTEYYFAVEDVAAQKWLVEDLSRLDIQCHGIRPDKDKIRRAISITDLLEQGRCRVNDHDLAKQLIGFPGDRLKDLVDAYVGCLKMVKDYGASRYEKEKTVHDQFINKDGTPMNSHQAWFKQTRDYAKKQMTGETGIEEYDPSTGDHDPNYY